MLKKANRIKQKKDFDKIFREGKKINTDFLFIKVVDNHSGKSRFGFVISKKISKKSTVRNKIKRILGEIIQKRIPEIKKGIDIVTIVKKDFSKMPLLDIDNLVYLVLKKNSLLEKK
jgi:ribonuclease P protein component